MKAIIKAEHLSKRYRLGTRDAAYDTVREALVNAARAPLQLFRRNGNGKGQTLWALRDVSFEINPGEVVGIIGRNGAGKSTLLRILSRVTEPTTGRVELFGRVGSLLEVGTGFHPELTGRENIFLNGSILGMTRHEIEKKFDEIVAFAEVAKFIDTPVKRYSSGMYVRLAFAVAGHLEPEILMVDEVLAVGDHAFQQKCLSKMHDVSVHGRTVLFVSHNMGAISRLCQRCIVLDQGQIIFSGPTADAVQIYMTSGLMERAEFTQSAEHDKDVRLRRVALLGEDNQIRGQVGYDEKFRLHLEYEVNRAVTGVSLGLGVYTSDGTCAFQTADFDVNPQLLVSRSPGIYHTDVEIPPQWLNTGRHMVKVEIANGSTGEVYDVLEAITFTLLDVGTPGSRNGINRRGVLQPLLNWTTTRTDE